MPDETITFELGGRVDIKQMSEGIAAFNHLIDALTGREEIKWLVVDLQSGSAIATLRPECENPAVSERIVQDYKNVGKALQNKEEIPGNSQVKSAAESIRKLVDSVEYLRLEAVGEKLLYLRKRRILSKTINYYRCRIGYRKGADT